MSDTVETQSSDKDIVDEQTGQPTDGAVFSFPKAYDTYKSIEYDNKQRNLKAAAVQRKRDGEQPYSPRKLKASGQAWRNNRPTFFMSSMLKRIQPPFKQMVDQLPYLTYSHFPNDKLGSEAEQDKFRKRITNTIRADENWADFVSQLIDENSTFGYASPCCLNEYKWQPRMYRGDECMFYVGAPQMADKIDMFAVKEDLFVHEAVEIIRAPKQGEMAGWRIKNLIGKLNTAGLQFNDYTTQENARVYEDLIRENNLASSFTSAVKVVKLGHLLATDPTGGVNHYIFDRDDGTPFYFKRKKFSNMNECIAPFTAEVGDRTIQGSKGAGRVLYNTHVTVDQARNLIQDALHLSGLLLVKRKKAAAGEGDTEGPALMVAHPFAILGNGFEPVENVKFEVNTEAFFALDRHAVALAEVQVGAFMPGQVQDQTGDKRTAYEVSVVAEVESKIRAGILARFADQLFNLINMMQRRICHPEVLSYAAKVFEIEKNNICVVFDKKFYADLEKSQATEGFQFMELPCYIDKAAVMCCVEMLHDGLDKKKILILANQSCRANVDDAIASQSGVLDMVVATYAADPQIDGVELKRRDLSSKLGAEAAERLMNVDMNPLSAVNQGRLQILELTSMLAGAPVPVVSTDDDKVHLTMIKSRVLPMIENPNISPLAMSRAFLSNVVDHAKAHIQNAEGKGVKPAMFAEEMKIISIIEGFVQKMPMDQAAASMVDSAAQNGVSPAMSINGAQPVNVPTPDASLPPNATPSAVVADAANTPPPAPMTPPTPQVPG